MDRRNGQSLIITSNKYEFFYVPYHMGSFEKKKNSTLLYVCKGFYVPYNVGCVSSNDRFPIFKLPVKKNQYIQLHFIQSQPLGKPHTLQSYTIYEWSSSCKCSMCIHLSFAIIGNQSAGEYTLQAKNVQLTDVSHCCSFVQYSQRFRGKF